jgi:predicted nucleotidyltransferase
MASTVISQMTVNELRVRLQGFCQNHPIEKLEVFGSVAKGTVNPESDVDLLATFPIGLPEGFAYFGFVQELEDELAEALGRKVDLLDRKTVEQMRNPIRRNEILNRAKVIYERVA